MTAHRVLLLLLEAVEHLAYRQTSGAFLQRRLEDGTLIPVTKWHHAEAERLLAEARQALCAVPTTEEENDE